MKVCYFGAQTTLTRNKILVKGLKQNNVDVDEIIMPKFNKLEVPFNYIKALRRYLSFNGKPDVFYVAFSGMYLLPLIKAISEIKDVPIVLDSFISQYDTYVHDRKTVMDGSLVSRALFLADRYSCRLADVSILDTNEHITYFSEEFGIDMDKFRRVFVGADDAFFKPRDEEHDGFSVRFYGTFIPVHGIQYILRAAKILRKDKDISIEILGRGQTYEEMLALKKRLNLKNVSFREPVPYERLQDYIAGADVCLGLFGDSLKTTRAVPTKYYECIAMRKAVITSDTPAMREFAEDYKHALFCKRADECSLAEKIVELKGDETLRKNIANNSYDKYLKTATPKVLGKHLENVFVETGK